MTVSVTVIEPVGYFEAGDVYDWNDFATWLSDGTVPDGLGIATHQGRYRVKRRRLVGVEERRPASSGRSRRALIRRPAVYRVSKETRRETLAALADALRDGVPPTYRELARRTGKVDATAWRAMQVLQADGLVQGQFGKHRGWTLTERGLRELEAGDSSTYFRSASDGIGLTEKQAEMLLLLARDERAGCVRTYEELGGVLRLTLQGAFYRIKVLADLGLVTREKHAHRSHRLTPAGWAVVSALEGDNG